MFKGENREDMSHNTVLVALVENVAAMKIGRETVQFVSNIGKCWVAYRLASRHIEKLKQPTMTQKTPLITVQPTSHHMAQTRKGDCYEV